MLVEKIYASKAAKIRQTPCHTNRASEAGHPCERYLVLRRTNWRDAALHDVQLQLLFEEGGLQEQAVLRDLQDAGWTIIEQQRDYEWKLFELTAHLDGKVLLDDHEAAPIEIKSMSPWIFEKVNTLDDLLNAAQPWLQKYPAQIQLYLLLANAPRGFLILKNKATGELKEIEVQLDYNFSEGLLKKLERVNAHIAAGTVPDPIPYDSPICDRCPFYQRVCMPEVIRDAMQISEDSELAAKLARRGELEPLKKEFEKLDKEVKEELAGLEHVICGDYLILGREQHRKGYAVPDATFWTMTIKPIPKEGD